ncbi:alpha/beta hydrolase [Pontibacillus salicampi]|uniref:Alpha/beta hydrolase n=1 Tax=Pontibacillus salicampi TaxID=1449801 RepID=A0ABV6LQ85_9BACI
MRKEVDQETIQLLNKIGRRMKELEHPPLAATTPEMSRYYYEEARAFFTPLDVEGINVLQFEIGKHSIPIRIYRPTNLEEAPIELFFHGGGWVFGHIDSVDSFCRYMAKEINGIVISVGYRLSPENPFPAPLEDALDVVEWVTRHKSIHKGDITRLGVGGESSGANIAAALTIMLRDREVADVHHQFLITPVTNFHFDTPSYRENFTYNLTTEKMKWFWNHYLPNEEAGLHPLASPLQVEDPKGLPTALIVTAEYDPLRSEGAAYAEMLDSHGVEVNHLHFTSLVHSFINMMGEVKKAKEAVDSMLSQLKRSIQKESGVV